MSALRSWPDECFKDQTVESELATGTVLVVEIHDVITPRIPTSVPNNRPLRRAIPAIVSDPGSKATHIGYFVPTLVTGNPSPFLSHFTGQPPLAHASSIPSATDCCQNS